MMRVYSLFSDKLAISLSAICAIHCLILPLIISLVPSFSSLSYSDESFHLWMVIMVIPFSTYALTIGCKEHKNVRVLGVGGMGLIVLVGTVILGEARLGEFQEKLFTLIGAFLIATSHLWNYRLCRKQESCSCSSDLGARPE